MLRFQSKASGRALGMTLIESMIAMLVFLTGIVGVMQGVITASHQNATANKVTTAGAMAQQLRTALAVEGRDRLATSLFTASCESGANAAKLGGGLEAVSGTPCVIDVDAWEKAGNGPLVPGFVSPNGGRTFQRAVVRLSAVTNNRVDAAVIVSFQEGGQRIFAKQFLTLFNAASVSANSEL